MHTKTNGFVPGLEGIVAAQTRLSRVEGKIGQLTIAGFPVGKLASQATFEEVVHLFWHDRLPNTDELNTLQNNLAQLRPLSPATITLLQAAVAANVDPMDALLMAASTISLGLMPDQDAKLALVARLPTIVAAYWRLSQNLPLITPDPNLSHAANYLYMLTGTPPSPAQTRGLETYLNTVVDHGLNASTFTARVIIATDSDMISAIVGAIGALKGPKHGGAPGPALDMVFDIGTLDQAEPYIRAKLERGERLMGFGHRVYKVRDPRAEILAQATETLFQADGDMALYDLVKGVEKTAVSLLAEYKPGRNLQTNVEFYTALLLHGLGLDTALFTPTFAIGRVVGWIAHCLEQQSINRIIRPLAQYIGQQDRNWVPLTQR